MLDLGLLHPTQSYLLAVSGGRDSVCLLEILLAHGIRKLHLVHLNHQLRGQESDDDAAFIQTLAEQHGLPLTLHTTPVATLAEEHGESIETAARKARHQLFAQVARTTQCRDILLAHHADDQAETCLFNLLRGSSGVKGMQSHCQLRVDDQTLNLLRPLLKTRRKEIDCYLTENRISYREDSSNQELDYTRNRIRHELLPLTEKILLRDCVPALLRAELATRESEQILHELLTTLELQDPQGRLFLPKLRNLSPSLQRACLKSYLLEHHISQISRPLLEHARALIPADGPPALNLPGNRYLRRRESRLFLL